MEVQNIQKFPYEINNVTPEEQDRVDKVFGSVVNVNRLCRVGPKGYILYEPYKKDAANIYNMPLRATDVFVASYQRSGTTMTQELVWLIKNNLDYSTALKVPLKNRYTFLEFFVFYDENKLDGFVKCLESNMDEDNLKQSLKELATPVSEQLAAIPESINRFIKTHLPMSLLNPKLLDTSKMVYVARDPRDVAVSCYHCAKFYKIVRFPGGFKEFWNIFCNSLYIYCPIFEHVKEAWQKRNHPNMLFLFYEDLLKDMPGSIRRVAKFLDKTLEPVQVEDLRNHLNIENFRNNKAVNHDELRQTGTVDKNESFIRKGKAGGWRNYFDEEMTQQAELWIADNLKDTDLRFPVY